jgi:hypothetical protein
MFIWQHGSHSQQKGWSRGRLAKWAIANANLGSCHRCHALSQGTSRLSYCTSSWTTLLVAAMGQETPKDWLQPPMRISWQPAGQPSLKQENHLRSIIGFVPSSPSLGSTAAPSTRRYSLQCSNFWAMLGHGGPTSPPLCPPTIKDSGLSSVKHSRPNTFQRALC